MEVTVKDRQSLFDISVQCLGGIEGVFSLAERNGLGITDRLSDGQVLTWEVADTVNAKVQQEYTLRGIVPATDMEVSEWNALLATAYALPATEQPQVKPSDDVPVDKIDQIITDLENGKEIVSGSGQVLTRLFDNPFDIVFALVKKIIMLYGNASSYYGFFASRKLCPYVDFAVSRYSFLLLSPYHFCVISSPEFHHKAKSA